MICITGGQLRLGGNIIFSDLSWRIDAGKRIGLVGPNGSGKTSILRVLTGEYTLENGKVESAKNFTIGYLPQDSAELPQQRVRGGGGDPLERFRAGQPHGRRDAVPSSDHPNHR